MKETQNIFDGMLSPNLSGKSILDLCCGYGENCAEFSMRGAKNVIGIDISQEVLDIARYENPTIEFICMDMNDLSSLDDKFDIIFCSLAMHYFKNFKHLATSAHRLLNNGGCFIFSQEHPQTMASFWDSLQKDEADGFIFQHIETHYAVDGEEKTRVVTNNRSRYRRTLPDLSNILNECGFTIEKVAESIPSEETSRSEPDFLLVKAKKE